MPLRIAYAGYNFFSSCLRALIEEPGVDVVTCLTGTREESVDAIVDLASGCGAPVIFGRPDEQVIRLLQQLEVDLVVCAAYSFRFPIEAMACDGINVHPSLLPAGRGPNPLPYLVSDRRADCGVTVHELTSDFDSGPILLQERIELQLDDGFEELALKLYVRAPALLLTVIQSFSVISENAVEQTKGTYWPAHSDDARTMDASQRNVSEARALRRQFGPLMVRVATVDGLVVEGSQLCAATCAHDYQVGSVVARTGDSYIVALPDGVLRLDGAKVVS